MSISKNSNNLQLDTARHSFAHLLAGAVYAMFPDAQFGVGPVIENGCYYDFVLPRVLIPEDLVILEQKINSLLQKPLEYKEEFLNFDQARELFMARGQWLKVELINDLENKKNLNVEEDLSTNGGVTIWRISDSLTGEMIFEDLCKGPHIASIKELRKVGFKLDKMSAVYWRGDATKQTMQRIYCLIMEDKASLNLFILNREEAKKRDHRTLNISQKFFTISELVGSGLPLMQPRGFIIRKLIQDYLWQIHKSKSYQQVWTPHIAKQDLYNTSGHAKHYLDDMFSVYGGTSKESFYLKPMNCPHHMQLFTDNYFSYKDMPIRYFEHATVYRDEKTGQLSGLTRVRNITQDDGHLFVRLNQMNQEIDTVVSIVKEFMETFGMKPDWVSLSVRDDTDSWLGTQANWKIAESALEEAAKKHNIPCRTIPGEAAFYGPKLDFQYKDVIGREWQLSTIQIDFNLPERFDLGFINEKGEKERPVVIHRAISGSAERFLGILIEHFAGRFPFWLAPTQVKILTINDTVLDYLDQITEILDTTILMKPLKYNEVRYEIDTRAESLNKKIKEAELNKVPVIIVIGPKDKDVNQLSLRLNLHGEAKETKISLSELKTYIEGL
jgi:threonyl-tRNA synthetase